MNKKIISFFTLLAFIVFSLSCYTARLKEIRTAADWKGEKGKILRVVKTSGEYIEFSKKRPGRISEDNIIGIVIILNKDVEIDRANIKGIINDKKGRILEITTKDEKIYHVVTGTTREEEDKIILSGELLKSISIPFSEVKSIQVKRIDPFKTFLLGVSIAGVIVGAFALIMFATHTDD